jgi:hypothetical protein
MQMLQQRLLRARGRHQPGGDELPGGGLPLRRRLRPQRHARRLRLLLLRAAERDGLPRAAAQARGSGPAAAAELLCRSVVRPRRCCGRGGRMPLQSPTAAHSLIDRDPSFFSCPRVALLLSSLLLLSMCSWYIGVSLVLPVKAGTELRLRELVDWIS